MSYFASLTQKHPSVDPNVFAALLVTLVTQGKSLVLRVPESDVVRLSNLVANMLITLFGLPTQRIHGKKTSEPQTLLRSMFIVPPTSPVSEATISSAKHSQHFGRPTPRQSFARSGNPPAEESSSSDMKPPLSGTVRSFRQAIAQHTDDASMRLGKTSSHSPGHPLLSVFQTPESYTMELPHTPPANESPRLKPILHLAKSSSSRRDTLAPKLPHAIVATRLDRLPFETQSTFSEVLRTRRVVLEDDLARLSLDGFAGIDGTVWNLPDGFFVVYVCPTHDGSKRAPLPPFLLDAFSFDAVIPSTFISDPSPTPPLSSLRLTPQISRNDLKRLRSLASGQTHISTHLSHYMNNLMIATRHHPILLGTLLSAQCVQDLEDFVRASRVVFGPSIPSFGNSGQTTPSNKDTADILSCTDADVRRVFPGVVRHRLETRMSGDGPLGSLAKTAVTLRVADRKDYPRDDGSIARSEEGGERIERRLTVNELLADILGTV